MRVCNLTNAIYGTGAGITHGHNCYFILKIHEFHQLIDDRICYRKTKYKLKYELRNQDDSISNILSLF